MNIFEIPEWPKISNLVNLCWEHYNNVRHYDFVAKQIMPILWFGDLEAYFNSDIKIVTAGSNPSDLEFALEDRRKKDANKNILPITPSFKRFEGGKTIFENESLTDEEIKYYTLIVNNYFKNENRYDWFNCFEPVLNGFSASYHELGAYRQKNEDYRENNYNNIAVHTDIYSPLATNPTWGDLDYTNKKALELGTELWIKLIDILKPDVILMGYSPNDFKLIANSLGFRKISSAEDVFRRYTVCRDGSEKKNTYVDLYLYEKNNTKSIVLYGTKSNRPFDKILKEERYQLGKDIMNMMLEGELSC